MARALVFTHPNDRDYGVDYLMHGLAELLGPFRVLEFPRKPNLHHVGERVMDCDFDLDTEHASTDDVRARLHDRHFDLVVVPTLRGSVPQRLYFWREQLSRNADRLVFVDSEDGDADLTPILRETLGIWPVASFKRELPLGATWAKPLPFGYPAERVQTTCSEGRGGAIYAVECWPGPHGVERERLGDLLRAVPSVFVNLSDQNGRPRLSVGEYHERTRKALVAISPAGEGYFTNRHFDAVANGCVPILPEPTREWPHRYIEHVQCRYYRSLDAVPALVREMLANPDECAHMALAAQGQLLTYHTTLVRARTVWSAVHGEAAPRD